MKYWIAIVAPGKCRQFKTENEAKIAFPNAQIMTDEDYCAMRKEQEKNEPKYSVVQPKQFNWFERVILRKKPPQPSI